MTNEELFYSSIDSFLVYTAIVVTIVIISKTKNWWEEMQLYEERHPKYKSLISLEMREFVKSEQKKYAHILKERKTA